MQGISRLPEKWLASQGHCSMESVSKIHGLRFIFWQQNAIWAYSKTQCLSIWTTQPAHRILWWYNHRSEIINGQSAITLHMFPTINTMFQIHAEWYFVNVLDSLWKRSCRMIICQCAWFFVEEIKVFWIWGFISTGV